MTTKPTMIYGVATDIGSVRSENQDTCGVFPPGDEIHPKGKLFVVADGMGGHRGGKEASGLAVKMIARDFFASDGVDISTSLARVIQAANEIVYDTGQEDSDLEGMGTTCVAMVVTGDRIHLARVGDSRAYRVTKKEIKQITDDHSTVAEMQRRGILTAEEAKIHPERSVLYRALGTRPVAEVDVHPEIEVTSNEWYVLCTDGLTNMVEDNEIHEMVTGNAPQKACDELIRLANERGGFDNITVEVIQIKMRDSFIDKLRS